MSAAHHIVFSEITNYIKFQVSCNKWQIGDLDCDLLLRLVEDCMAVERDIVDVLQVLLINELLNSLREKFRVLYFHFFEGKKRNGFVL